MAFVAGVNRATGYLVPADVWNNYMGVDGSIDVLHQSLTDLWVPVTLAKIGGTYTALTALGNFAVAALADANDVGIMNFRVPSNFSAITTASIVVVSAVTDAAANWDIYATFAASGQAYTTHTTNDTATTYNVTQNQIYLVNCAGILAALAANDYCGIQLLLGDSADDVYVVGFYMNWSL